jgi:hypothetical protein
MTVRNLESRIIKLRDAHCAAGRIAGGLGGGKPGGNVSEALEVATFSKRRAFELCFSEREEVF